MDVSVAALTLVLLVLIGTATSRSHSYSVLRSKHSGLRQNSDCHLTEFSKEARCYHGNETMQRGCGVDCLGWHLICEGGISAEWLRGMNLFISWLTVRGWPGVCLNVDRLQSHFPELRALEVEHSAQLNTLKGNFPNKSKIERIELHGLTSLVELSSTLFLRMGSLKKLDLRNNVLKHLRAGTLDAPRLNQVYLTNNKWDCSDGGMDWLALEGAGGPTRSKILDYQQLLCHQVLYKGKPLHKVMEMIKMVSDTCPAPCACVLAHVVADATADGLRPIITVDCSARALHYPPETLPPNTMTIKLQHNRISTVRFLVQNPQYRGLADVFLDNNSITSLKELEGAEWLSTFRLFSLRGNTIDQFPIYAFDRAFQVNKNMLELYLGNNPWRCDCTYMPRLQSLIFKYTKYIKDIPDIRCSDSSDKAVANMRIISISIAKICEVVESTLSVIDVVNLVLAGLLIMVLGRFFYDCYSFKTTGRLPWISSILP